MIDKIFNKTVFATSEVWLYSLSNSYAEWVSDCYWTKSEQFSPISSRE